MGTMIILLLIGFIALTAVALRKGFRFSDVLKMTLPGVKNSLIVIKVLLLIGCLTGLWRASGTIAYFITAGVRIMPPSLFVLSAFLLTSLMSFAIGTSFGVAATCGVILMSIARAGGMELLPVAGAVLSGLYLGDRGSPAASSAALVAALTGTEMRRNIRLMLRSSLVPFLLSTAVYAALSFFFPLGEADKSLLSSLSGTFRLSWILLLPAILMIVLPFAKVSVKLSMAIDIVVSFLLTVAFQGMSFPDTLKCMVLGYTPESETLASLLSGGGIVSMAKVAVILLISGTYGGIFRETGLLDGLNAKLSKYRETPSRFPVLCVLSLLSCAVFCNQTIGIIMVNELSGSMYGSSEEEKYAKMLDIEDSVTILANLVPWCIASSVPRAMLGVGPAVIPLCVFLWLLPLWRILNKKRPATRVS